MTDVDSGKDFVENERFDVEEAETETGSPF